MNRDTENRPQWLQRLHDWRVANVSDKMFLLILAFLVGVLSAVAAFVCGGYLVDVAICALCGQRQYLAWNYPHTLCYFLEPLTSERT